MRQKGDKDMVIQTLVKHHPTTDFITDFAAGTLPVAQAALHFGPP